MQVQCLGCIGAGVFSWGAAFVWFVGAGVLSRGAVYAVYWAASRGVHDVFPY